jgi:ferritin-like metal-binding protein YciE
VSIIAGQDTGRRESSQYRAMAGATLSKEQAMGLFTTDVDTLRDLYTTELKKALNMERQLIDALPKMIEKSNATELANAFRTHLEQTKEHAARVERILNDNTGETDDSRCKGMSSLISEGESQISAAGNEAIRDVVLIAAGNQVEHHEMAVYGTLRNWAMILGEQNHAQLLERNLEDEKQADKLLTSLAEQINVSAPVA